MRVAVVGSGLAAFGVISELTKKLDLQIDVWDIGHTSPSTVLHAFRKLPNSLTISDSYYPYGLNDPSDLRQITSTRLCSSHAWQGFATVYSGSMVCPSQAEFVAWPKTSIPSEDDYLRPRGHFDIASALSNQDVLHSGGYLDLNQHNHKVAITTISSVAVHRNTLSERILRPFGPGEFLSNLISSKRISYFAKRNVLYIQRDTKSRLTLHYESHKSERLNSNAKVLTSESNYDAIFLAAGCVNTTSIVDLSLRKLDLISSATSLYQVQSCPLMTMLHLRVPGKKLDPELKARRESGLCTHFYEKHVEKLSSWSHTQFGFIGAKQLQSLPSAPLLRIINPILSMLLQPLAYSLTVFHSMTGKNATTSCQVTNPHEASEIHIVSIKESGYVPKRRIVYNLFCGILKAFKDLGLVPIPFSSWITRKLRSRDAGGWHMGGTLPFSDNPIQPHLCHASGELSGIPGLFICDSSTFPTIPGSTIAYTIMANSSRIANKWVNDHSHI